MVDCPRAGKWFGRDVMPEGRLFLAAWLDSGEIDQVELLVNARHDGKWLNQNSGNWISDPWSLWMPCPDPTGRTIERNQESE